MASQSAATRPQQAPGWRFWRRRGLTRRLFYDWRVQLGLSVASGALAAVAVAVSDGTSVVDRFETQGDFIAFLSGIAGILALVSSLTFGFLLYYLQTVTAERQLLYERFKDGVRRLRDFLDSLREEGLIDDAADYHFGAIDEITLKDFPILPADLNDRFGPVLDLITEEFRDELEAQGEFGRVLRGVAYRVNDIEELNVGLFMNWLKHTTIETIGSPVVKAFQTLAAVILVILVSAVAYGGTLRTILFGCAVGLGAMTLALVIELGLVAARQAQMVYEESYGLGEANESDDRGDQEYSGLDDGRDVSS